MNFDIDAKIIKEAIKLASVAKTTKPMIPAIFLSLDKKKLYISGMESSGAIQSAVTIRHDVFTTYEITEEPVPIAVARILKILTSMKGNVNVKTDEEKVYITGSGIEHYENIPTGIEPPVIEMDIKDNAIPLPKIPTEDDYKPFDAILKMSSIPKTAVINNDTIDIKIDNNVASIVVSDEISGTKIELTRDIKWYKEPSEMVLTFSSETLKTVMDMLKSSVAMYINDKCAYCLCMKDWGYAGYLIPVWGSV